MPTGTAHRSVWGHLRNVAPAAFVQMIAIERESCALGVRADGSQGTLFFVAGELCDAILEGWRGEEAAILILGWDRADIETKALAEPPPRSINAPLTFILLEAMRRRDERSNPAGKPVGDEPQALVQALAEELEGVRGVCLIDLSTGLPLAEHSAVGQAFDAATFCQAAQGLARTELALLAALGRRSVLEEIVLTFGDLLVVVRPARADALLVLIADSARTSLPAIHSALQRLAPDLQEDVSTWQE